MLANTKLFDIIKRQFILFSLINTLFIRFTGRGHLAQWVIQVYIWCVWDPRLLQRRASIEKRWQIIKNWTFPYKKTHTKAYYDNKLFFFNNIFKQYKCIIKSPTLNIRNSREMHTFNCLFCSDFKTKQDSLIGTSTLVYKRSDFPTPYFIPESEEWYVVLLLFVIFCRFIRFVLFKLCFYSLHKHMNVICVSSWLQIVVTYVLCYFFVMLKQ